MLEFVTFKAVKVGSECHQTKILAEQKRAGQKRSQNNVETGQMGNARQAFGGVSGHQSDRWEEPTVSRFGIGGDKGYLRPSDALTREGVEMGTWVHVPP